MQGFSMSLFPLTVHLEYFNHVVATAYWYAASSICYDTKNKLFEPPNVD